MTGLSSDHVPQRTLRARDAVAITVGIVLGAGIFRTPSLVASGVESGWALMAVWVAGALIAGIGALCYAELASAYPDAGGDYQFLRLAFGERLAFLYGWARLMVIQTGSAVVIAFVLGDYASELLRLGTYSSAIYAGVAMLLLTGINWLGVRQGTGTQNWLTMLEVGGLILVIVAGLLLAPAAAATPVMGERSSLGLVMVFVLLTYGGWNEAAYLSAELRGGGRRVARVLFLSLALLALLFVLANAAYLRALGLSGMAGSQAVGAEVMRAAFGAPGATLIAIVVAVSTLTSVNATLFTGARSAYALGRDVPLLRVLGRWHGPSGTPRAALLVQGAIGIALCAGGAFARDGFQLAVEYTAPVFWFFFLCIGVALFRLRRHGGAAEGAFRVPLYPVTPALFCLINAWLLWSSLAYTGWGALVGVGVVALGGVLLLLVPRSVGVEQRGELLDDRAA